MLVDGRAIAREVLAEVRAAVLALSKPPQLSIITATPDLATKKYLALKQRRAAEVGIAARVIELLPEATTEEVTATVRTAAEESDSVVVQLPLPPGIEREEVLASVPVKKDPEGFRYGLDEAARLPPVVGAIVEIAARYGVRWDGATVAVVGAGRLVGAPVARFAREAGARVRVFEKGDDLAELIGADVIISGVGVAGLITPDQVREGAVVFDAGTSEASGELRGDVAPDVAATAALLTPVPGGIGPVTVAMLLRNVAVLASARLEI